MARFYQKKIFYVVLTIGLAGTVINAGADIVDPTQPADKSEINAVLEVDENGMVLNAVLYNQLHPVAIVNGQTVSIGEKIAAYWVKSITQSQVTLQDNQGKTITLSMPAALLQPVSP